ncbi:hypothetical protein CBOM_02459 [Ceraceosorus bombacis]|uniref:Uncharacterized protein n=1 Tax=Ceraceosorus bombacis TaxID=401625 RepID=A0A0P1BES6_9BASI|nr:hypothetical protein CBOM_02459 [Ceraceosorus bombacis]
MALRATRLSLRIALLLAVAIAAVRPAAAIPLAPSNDGNQPQSSVLDSRLEHGCSWQERRVGNCYNGRSIKTTDALAERATTETDDLDGRKSMSLLSRSGASPKSSMLDSRLERGCSWQELRVGNCYRSIMDELSGVVQALRKRSTADRLSRRDDHDSTALGPRAIHALGEPGTISLVVRDDYACYCIANPSECSWQGPPPICSRSVKADHAGTALVDRATNAVVESGSISLVTRDNSNICWCIANPSSCIWHGPPVNCRRSIAESNPLSHIAEQIELERRADKTLTVSAADASAELKRRQLNPIYCEQHPTAPGCGHPNKRDLAGAAASAGRSAAILPRQSEYCMYFPLDPDCQPMKPPGPGGGGEHPPRRSLASVGASSEEYAELLRRLDPPTFCSTHPNAPNCKPPRKRSVEDAPKTVNMGESLTRRHFCDHHPDAPDCSTTSELARRDGPGPFCASHSTAPECQGTKLSPRKRSSSSGSDAGVSSLPQTRRSEPCEYGKDCPDSEPSKRSASAMLSVDASPRELQHEDSKQSDAATLERRLNHSPCPPNEPLCGYASPPPPKRSASSALGMIDGSAKLLPRLAASPACIKDPTSFACTGKPPRRRSEREVDRRENSPHVGLLARATACSSPFPDPACYGIQNPPHRRSMKEARSVPTMEPIEQRAQSLKPCGKLPPGAQCQGGGSPPPKRSVEQIRQTDGAQPGCPGTPAGYGCPGIPKYTEPDPENPGVPP